MKPDQERVKNLLQDTVTLLCRNGLSFHDELKVEGLIGITLDNNEVFLVHINDKFGSGTSSNVAPQGAVTALPPVKDIEQSDESQDSENGEDSRRYDNEISQDKEPVNSTPKRKIERSIERPPPDIKPIVKPEPVDLDEDDDLVLVSAKIEKNDDPRVPPLHDVPEGPFSRLKPVPVPNLSMGAYPGSSDNIEPPRKRKHSENNSNQPPDGSFIHGMQSNNEDSSQSGNASWNMGNMATDFSASMGSDTSWSGMGGAMPGTSLTPGQMSGATPEQMNIHVVYPIREDNSNSHIKLQRRQLPSNTFSSKVQKESLMVNFLGPLSQKMRLMGLAYRVVWRSNGADTDQIWKQIAANRDLCDRALKRLPAVALFVSSITGVFNKPSQKGATTRAEDVHPALAYWVVPDEWSLAPHLVTSFAQQVPSALSEAAKGHPQIRSIGSMGKEPISVATLCSVLKDANNSFIREKVRLSIEESGMPSTVETLSASRVIVTKPELRDFVNASMTVVRESSKLGIVVIDDVKTE